MPWGARMEGAEEQKRRADHVQPPEQDLANEAFSDVHAASPDVRKTGCAALHQSQELLHQSQEKAEAVRRARKAARKTAIREGLIAAPKPKPRFGGGPRRPGFSSGGGPGPQS